MTPLDRRLAVAAAALAVIAGGVIAGQWIYERMQVGKELRQVEALAGNAERAARDLARQSNSAAALIKLIGKTDALNVLTSLTSSVPADSWAYEVDVAPGQGGVLQAKVGGFTPTSTVLVNVLEKTPELEQVRLVSSASAGIGTGKDRMKLTARWAGK